MENTTHLFPVSDIAGVEGVFVIDSSSRLVAMQCKAIFSIDLVQRAALRITTLFGALTEYLRPAQEVTLVFDHFQILLRLRDSLMIAVITQGEVNQVALKLACNVALRKLQESQPGPGQVSPLISRATAPTQGARPAAAPTNPAPRPVPPKPQKPKSQGIWG